MKSIIAFNIFNCICLFLFLTAPITAQVGSEPKVPGKETVISERDDIVYMSDFMEEAERHFKEYPGGYKQYKRLEQYMLNHLGEDGRIVNATVKNYRAYQEQLKRKGDIRSMVWAHNGSWEFIGPNDLVPITTPNGVGQGRVNRFGFHPTDPNTVFASTSGGGLWKTTDKGLTWDPLSDGIPVMNTTGVAVDFNDPEIIYLLSGDGDGLGSFYYYNEFTRTSVGLFKTTDGGGLWQPTGLMFEETDAVLTYNLYMSPVNPLVLYVCTNIGLFRTIDGGNSWDTLRNGLVYEMEFKPGTPLRIYCVDDEYIYISNNGGNTWVDSTYIPPVDGRVGRMAIATCDGNPNLVYLLASPTDTLTPGDTLPDMRGFFVSFNSGDDFILASTKPNLLAGGSGTEFKSQAWYDIAVECNPLNEIEILVGTIGIWKSEDAGFLFTYDNGINEKYHADIHTIQVNPLDNTIWVGDDGGVNISEDFGETYSYRSLFLGITQYYKIATSPFFTNYVLAGAQDNGSHLRDDVETQLDRVIFDDGMDAMFHPTVDSLVIASTHLGRVFLSTDTAHSFTEILPRIKGSDSVAWTTVMTFDAGDPDVIYVGYKPVMKSTDGGVTFNATSNDSISGHRFLENNVSNPNRLYTGDCQLCDEPGIWFEMYTSPDGGSTWDRIDMNPGFPSPGYFITDATVNPDNSQEVWVCVGRYSDNVKVFRSTNGGDTWTNMSGTLPNVPVNAIVFEDNNGNPGGAVYISTDIGVFYRNDDLDDWVWFNNNMPAVEVTDLAIDYNGGFLRAATYGRGMWESELFTECQAIISLNTSNQVLGHSYVHQATNHVFSTAHVDGSGSRVIYKCENQVHLTDGFRARAQNGARFKALISLCSEGGIEENSQGTVGVEKK